MGKVIYQNVFNNSINYIKYYLVELISDFFTFMRFKKLIR